MDPNDPLFNDRVRRLQALVNGNDDAGTQPPPVVPPPQTPPPQPAPPQIDPRQTLIRFIQRLRGETPVNIVKPS